MQNLHAAMLAYQRTRSLKVLIRNRGGAPHIIGHGQCLLRKMCNARLPYRSLAAARRVCKRGSAGSPNQPGTREQIGHKVLTRHTIDWAIDARLIPSYCAAFAAFARSLCMSRRYLEAVACDTLARLASARMDKRGVSSSAARMRCSGASRRTIRGRAPSPMRRFEARERLAGVPGPVGGRDGGSLPSPGAPRWRCAGSGVAGGSLGVRSRSGEPVSCCGVVYGDSGVPAGRAAGTVAGCMAA